MANQEELKQIQIRARRLEVLDETVKFYSEDINRLSILENGNCLYKTTDGKMCAIGRLTKNVDNISNLQNHSVDCNSVWDNLEDEIKQLGKWFLCNLQKLHDYKDYWNEKGLSEQGLNKYNDIKTEFCV